MRAKVKTSSSLIAQGPGTFRIRNKTNTAAIFLDVASVPETGTDNPAVTEAEGYEWGTSEGPLEVRVGTQQALMGLVATTEQEVHVLRNGPHF